MPREDDHFIPACIQRLRQRPTDEPTSTRDDDFLWLVHDSPQALKLCASAAENVATSSSHKPVNAKCISVSNVFPRHSSASYKNHCIHNRTAQKTANPAHTAR